MKNKEIKVKVTFTEGYEERFTKACLEVLLKREEKKKIEELAKPAKCG